MKTLNTNEILTLSIRVSEKIANKNLHNFIKSSIINSNLYFSKNTYYYFYYNLKTFTYEIIFYEKLSEEIILEPLLLIQHLNKNDNKVMLLLVKDYFVLTKNNKLLIFKKVNSIDKDEINLYVKQIYKIEEFEVLDITQKYLETLVSEQHLALNVEFISLYSKKSFYIFNVFVIVASFILILMLYLEYYKVGNVNDTKSTEKIVNIIKKDKIIDKTIALFKYIKLNNITIDKVSFSNKKIQTTLYHKKKSHLLSFANTYKKNFYIKLLTYDDIKDMYKMEIIVEN